MFIKNIPENNLEEEVGHTTAVTVSDTLAEFAGKSHDVRNLLNAVERLFKFEVSSTVQLQNEVLAPCVVKKSIWDYRPMT